MHKIFKQSPELMKQYDSVSNEQNVFSIIEGISIPATPAEIYYIPNYSIIKKVLHYTNKLRIFFDTSFKTDDLSANECP